MSDKIKDADGFKIMFEESRKTLEYWQAMAEEYCELAEERNKRIIELERELLNVRLGIRRGKKVNVEAEFAPYYPEEAGDER